MIATTGQDHLADYVSSEFVPGTMDSITGAFENVASASSQNPSSVILLPTHSTSLETLLSSNESSLNSSEVQQDPSSWDGPIFPEYIKTVSTVFCSIVLVVGVAGNILVPVVILKNRDMRNSTNCFLINLSLADLLVLLICLPSVLVELHTPPDTWVLGQAMCKLVPYVEVSVVHASALSLVVISLERYHVICRPLQAGYRCTKAKAITAIFIIWILALISAAPLLLLTEYKIRMFLDGSMNPNCITVAESVWSKCYFVTITTLFFFIPLLVLIGIYTIISRQLLIDTYDLTHNQDNPQLKARRQVVFMLATVVIFFFLCLMPFKVLFLWILAVPTETVGSLGVEGFFNLLYFCRVMHYINSSINPILYNMTSTKFRAAFLKVFTRRPSRIHRQNTCSNASHTNHTVTNNIKMQYGTNSSIVYKAVYCKSLLSHQHSYISTGSASSQFTRQSLVTRYGRTSSKDVYV